jgi:tagatose-1,6-bisphosphate aldolase non-catalytic subunit AgaZ/GatZ
MIANVRARNEQRKLILECDWKRLKGQPSADFRQASMLHYSFQAHTVLKSMLLSKEYVGYLARQVSQKLIAGEFIETKNVPAVSAALNNALLEELQLEDRINDEVRLILEQYQDEMQRAGASYQEMFKKVKGELVR